MSEQDKSPFGCPACHGYAIYRSKLRGFERVKKFFTDERPYRCHGCGWRGWLVNIRYAMYPMPSISGPAQPTRPAPPAPPPPSPPTRR